MPTMRCPANAPPGSKWTIVGGRFQCLSPDGKSIIPTDTGGAPVTPINPTNPALTPVPGVGGGAGLVTVPGRSGPTFGGQPSFGGVGGGSPVGGVGGGGKGIPWWASGGITLLGGIISGIGKQKQITQTKEEAARLEAEDRERARGKTALIRGILNANGYGSLMTDDQILAMVTKTGQRPNTEGQILGPLGNRLQGVGGDLLLDTYNRNRPDPRTARPASTSGGSSAPGAAAPTAAPTTGGSTSAVDPAQSQDFYEWLYNLIHNTDKGVGA